MIEDYDELLVTPGELTGYDGHVIDASKFGADGQRSLESARLFLKLLPFRPCFVSNADARIGPS